jgi:hypothetical protein
MNGFLKILLFLVLFLFTVVESKAIIEQKQIIRIIKGDNLWNISTRVYGSGLKYPKIWAGRLDSNISQNPNLIFPNMAFYIRPENTGISNSNDSDKVIIRNMGNDVTKIRDATLSIDGNIKKLLEPPEPSLFVKILSYVFNEFIMVILTGIIATIVSDRIIKKYL